MRWLQHIRPVIASQHVASKVGSLGDDALCLFLLTDHRWVELFSNRPFFLQWIPRPRPDFNHAGAESGFLDGVDGRGDLGISLSWTSPILVFLSKKSVSCPHLGPYLVGPSIANSRWLEWYLPTDQGSQKHIRWHPSPLR